ncbi:hypothetical protein MKO06_13070 [Gramella sp. GC03-9]|uniref:Uncharacterized protein n=1 Tax=Christiangramia oceanisediminis TaxID=2920386 RepID=A0A9X2RCA0_9FLAO|nr:hypothetical protein [Gramella oceanisediminis]MCP9200845.1 hypothetical protein [Gramella oceanisediminis]
MTTDYSASDSDLRDILNFEGIDYMKISFYDERLKNKGYHISVKEIWDGKIINDTTVFNSRDISIEKYETINDTVLNFRIVSKHTPDNKLKMSFLFPRFGVTREYDAIDSDEYSLRNLAAESDLEISLDKKFYLLAYILPYENEDGSKSWCRVGSSDKIVEN